jgi:hypothetical protein
VNETLAGEKCIVPLLAGILEDFSLPDSLRHTLEQQFSEELAHVRMFYNLIGREGLESSGFATELSQYVQTLPKVGLRLFALQGMLEGIALGALEHRLRHWKESPSRHADLRAYNDEKSHISCSFKDFGRLIEGEGAISPHEFRSVEKSINQIFVRAFRGSVICNFIEKYFPQEAPGLSADSIERSRAMTEFRQRSARLLVEAKQEFTRTYLSKVRRGHVESRQPVESPASKLDLSL